MRPVDSRTCWTPWSVFQDGTGRVPTQFTAIFFGKELKTAVRASRPMNRGNPRAGPAQVRQAPTRGAGGKGYSVPHYLETRRRDTQTAARVCHLLRPGRRAGRTPLPQEGGQRCDPSESQGQFDLRLSARLYLSVVSRAFNSLSKVLFQLSLTVLVYYRSRGHI